MPRGRPKGSKNKSSVPAILEGKEYAVKWTNHKGISWYTPMSDPFLDEEAALKMAEGMKTNTSIAKVEVVNMKASSNVVIDDLPDLVEE